MRSFVADDLGSRLLSDLVFYRTYAALLPSGRKETPQETIARVRGMHEGRYPHIRSLIQEAFAAVEDGLCVPSMRSMQFGGAAIERSHARMYNCSYLALRSAKDIADLFWLLMNGCGVGYSVQACHTNGLPPVPVGEATKPFVIPDSREGWAESVRILLENPKARFDYSRIRPANSVLSTGGTASGPEPLQRMHAAVAEMLGRAAGRRLRPIELHDVVCLVADSVVVGGVRRAALLALFDWNDSEMLASKQGSWWTDNPQRARANNSAIISRQDPLIEDKLSHVLSACFDSGSGEPGVYLTNEPPEAMDWGANPCVEIALRDGQFCNLTECLVARCETRADFERAAWAATVIGTLQAGYTDFHYIDGRFGRNTRMEALLGVSITGQAERWDWLSDGRWLSEVSRSMLETNAQVASLIGTRRAARIGCTKPSGTTSLFAQCTSGIHAAYASHYLRRVRIDREHPLARYLAHRTGVASACAGAFLEEDASSKANLVVTVPVKKTGAIQRSEESALDLLERTKHIKKHWIDPSHSDGVNTHNVSVTVNYAAHEVRDVAEWMARNLHSYSGIALLPKCGNSYVQMPFEEVSAAEYERRVQTIPRHIDFSQVQFEDRFDGRMSESACAGGACELAL